MADRYKKHCSVCAWRATCAKRYRGNDPDGIALHCPDFCFDETLRNGETSRTPPAEPSAAERPASTLFGEKAYRAPVKRYFDPEKDLADDTTGNNAAET